MTVELRNVRTTCPYCGVGCGVRAQQADERLLRVSGDETHPANQGRLCVKGAALGETLNSETRLLTPQVGGHSTSWDQALQEVATRLHSTLERYGPESIALYLSGQLLTEDYYVANKLMKGFLGSSNVDTNSRLCMASAVAAHKRAFGEDIVPCSYEDIDYCEQVVLVGSNAAWAHPILFQRIAQAKADRGIRLTVIDPRRTATCELADDHLPLRPGSDLALFNGLLTYLHDRNQIDNKFVNQHTNDIERALATNRLSLEETARHTGLSVTTIERFFSQWSSTRNTLTLFSQGINQSARGSDQGNAIINCHLATGAIGRRGMGPFSLTGQPNAMGGREVGGMANQLAAHMDFDKAAVDRVERFWNAKAMARAPGLKAVDLFQAMQAGKVRFIWILGTNPVVSMPASLEVRRALEVCETVVVSDCHRNTDTQRFADVLLPALPWGEKDGTVTNSERCISRQRCISPPMGEARSDWEALCGVASRLGFENAFDFPSAAAIFREHAALSAFENAGDRLFNLGELKGLSDEDYDALAPTYWPSKENPFPGGQFSTPDGRARFVATPTVAAPAAPGSLTLNTGRLRDQWHTMTRTGLVPKLNQHAPVPTITLHPDTARDNAIHQHDLVELCGPSGSALGLAELNDEVTPEQVFVPMHWTAAFSRQSAVNAAVSVAADPVSGQPALKHGQVTLTKRVISRWMRVFAPTIDHQELLRGFDEETLPFWSRLPLNGLGLEGVQLELGATNLDVPPALLARLNDWDEPHSTARVTMKASPADTAVSKCMAFGENRNLIWWASLAPSYDLLPPLPQAAPDSVSASRKTGTSADGSPLICVCHTVSEAEIQSELAKDCTTVTELGVRLRCGTNCGSCVPELARLVRQAQPFSPLIAEAR